MKKFEYEITERIAILSENGDWTKEFNKVSWNGRTPKYDLRDWNHKQGKIGEGVTMTYENLENLKEVLNTIIE